FLVLDHHHTSITVIPIRRSSDLNNDYAIKSGASIGNEFSSLINVNTKGFQNVLYSTEILAIESQNIDSLNYESYSLFNNIAADLVGKTHRDIILTKSRNELFSLSNLTKFDIAKSIRNFPTVGEMIDNKLFGMTSMIAPVLDQIVKNPVEYLATNALAWVIKDKYEITQKGILGRMNEEIASLPITLFDTLEDKNSKLNTILDRMPKEGMKGFFGRFAEGSLERISKAYLSGLREKGPSVKNSIARHTSVDFDAESHVSINKIIPGYLAKLLSVFEGKEELAYDYKTGLWKRGSDVRANVNNKINKEL